MIVHPTPVLDVVQPLVCRVGNKKSDRVTIMVYSRNSGDAVIECNGSTYSGITMTAYGTDRGEGDPVALYTGSQVVIVDDEFKEYSYKAIQAGGTIEGVFHTKPGLYDRYRFAVATCESSSIGCLTIECNDVIPSAYATLNRLADETDMPFTDLFFIDDIMYVDGAAVTDSGIDGVVTTGSPKVTLKEYDYGLAYACNLGLLPGDGDIIFGDAWVANHGLMKDRLDFYKKVGVSYQFGNHEFGGGEGVPNGGMDVPAQTAGAFHKTASGFDGPGMTAYDAIFRPLQSDEDDPRSLDTACNLWHIEYGSFHIVLADFITNADGGYVDGVSEAVMLGANQIDDIKACFASSAAPFQMLLCGHHMRSIDGAGTKHAIHTYGNSEYNRLMTDANGLMSLPSCNGALGTFMVGTGDTHRGQVLRYHGTNANHGGTLDEDYYCYNVGMPAHGGNHGDLADSNGETIDGATIDYMCPGTGEAGYPQFTKSDGRGTNHALIFDVFGDLGKVRVRMFNIRYDPNGEERLEFDKEFYWRKGNNTHDTPPANPAGETTDV